MQGAVAILSVANLNATETGISFGCVSLLGPCATLSLSLFCLGFRHCQDMKEMRDVIVQLLRQFEDLSGKVNFIRF